MKKQTLVIILLIVTCVLNAQLKVNTLGNIEIGTSPSTDCQLNLKGNSNLDGSVGIGVAPDPLYKLNLYGNAYLNGLVGIGTPPNTSYKLSLSGNSNFVGNTYFSGGNFNFTGPTTPSGTGFNVIGSNCYPGMSIRPASTFSSTFLLSVSGSITAVGLYLSSDINLKKDIKVLDGKQMLSKIMNIDGKKYEFKNNEELQLIYKDKNLASGDDTSNELMNLPKGERYGFIAQEI